MFCLYDIVHCSSPVAREAAAFSIPNRAQNTNHDAPKKAQPHLRHGRSTLLPPCPSSVTVIHSHSRYPGSSSGPPFMYPPCPGGGGGGAAAPVVRRRKSGVSTLRSSRYTRPASEAFVFSKSGNWRHFAYPDPPPAPAPPAPAPAPAPAAAPAAPPPRTGGEAPPDPQPGR